MADNDLQLKIGADISGATAGLKSVQEQIGEFSDSITNLLAPINSITGALPEMGAAIGSAFAFDRIVAFADKFADMGAQVVRTSQELGMSTEQVSSLDGAFEAMGLGSDGAGRMLERLERNMEQARTGAGPAAAAFRALGISMDDVKKLSPADMLNSLADIFSHTADGPAKTANAIALLGRAGAEMIPFLDRGREGLQEFYTAAAEAGTVLSSKTAHGMEDTAIKSAELHLAFEGLGVAAFEYIKGPFDAATDSVKRLVESFTALISMNPKLQALHALQTQADAIQAEIAKREQQGAYSQQTPQQQARQTLHGGTAFTPEGQAMAEQAGITPDSVDMVKAVKPAADLAGQSLDQLKAQLASLQKQIADASKPAATDSDGKPQQRSGAEVAAAMADAKDAADFKIKTAQDTFAAEAAELNQEVALGKISNDQKIELLKEYAKERTATEIAAMQEQALAGGLTVAQAQRIADQQKQINAKLQTELTKDDTDGAVERQKVAMGFEAFMAGQSQKILQIQLDGVQQEVAAEGGGNAQKFALMEQYTTQIYESQKKVLEDAMSQDNISLADKEKYWQDLYALGVDYQSKMAGLQRQATQNEDAWAKQGFDAISSDFDSAFKGMLQGTETFGTAMKKVFDNMATSFIEDVLKMISQYAAFATLQAVGAKGPAAAIGSPFAAATGIGGAIGSIFGGGNNNAASNTAQSAVEQKLLTAITGQTVATQANTSGLFQWIGQELQSLAQWLGLTTATTASTAATTANATATTTSAGGLIPALATVTGAIGTLDGAVGALTSAVIANTFAKAVPVPAFAGGSWSVPSTGLALIHAGEMIIPSAIASTVRGATASGVIGGAGDGGVVASAALGGGAASAGSGAGSGTTAGGFNVVFAPNVATLDSKSAIAALNAPQTMQGLLSSLKQHLESDPSVRPNY